MVQTDDHVLGPFRLILFVLLMLFALLYGLDLRQRIVRDLHAGGFQQSFFTDEQASVAVAHQFPIDHEQHLVGPIGDMLRVLFRMITVMERVCRMRSSTSKTSCLPSGSSAQSVRQG